MSGAWLLGAAFALGVAAPAVAPPLPAPAPISERTVAPPQAVQTPIGTPPGLAVDRASELLPRPPRGALENGMTGEIARLYALGIASVRSGQFRPALTYVRQARSLCYRAVQQGPGPRELARRHFVRLSYVEEELAELILRNDQLAYLQNSDEDRSFLLQVRAILLHNLLLAVRGFTGQTDARLLAQVLNHYEMARHLNARLKLQVQIGYAAVLAERGDRRAARSELAQLGSKDLLAGENDLPVAYLYLALGDRRRAISRLLEAARREDWQHGSPQREGHSPRSMAYRMSDFDLLRDHPRFIELVTEPEERDDEL